MVTPVMPSPEEEVHGPRDHPGYAKIRLMYDRGDFETIDRMVRFWEAMESIGKLGDVLRKAVIWCGIVAGGYFVFYGHITEWIKGISRQ